MKKYSNLLLILSFPFLLFGGSPDWVYNFGKSDKFPKEIYLTGFGIAALNKDHNETNCMEVSVQNAQKELINKIFVTIKSYTETRIEEKDEEYSQFYTSVTNSASHLRVWGCEVEKFYDKHSHTAYALVYVRRQKLIEHYNLIVEKLQNDISHYYNLGKLAEKQGNKSSALKYYLNCYPLFNRLFRARAIIYASNSRMNSIFAELDNRKPESNFVQISELNKAVERLRQQPIKNVEDLTLFMYSCFRDQLTAPAGKLIILPFTFQNTGMSSKFASLLNESLKNNISYLSGFRVLNSLQSEKIYSEVDITDFQTTDSLFLLMGTYWQQRDSIKIIAEICNYKNKQIKASMNIMIPQNIIIKTGLEIIPENFNDALQEQRIFSNGEVKNSGLVLEAWTNKGSNGVVFFDNEIMNVYLRINIPCYIRFIYHLANGVRTVLLDNYFIDRSYVNTAYKIPIEFVCDQPFGVEVLQIFAQTKPFKKIDIELHDGYNILKEDLYSFLKKTRGMKKVEHSNVLKTEERIVVTTMEN